MTRTARLVVAAVVAGTRWASAAPLVAEPPVRVVATAVNGSASATVALRNPGAATVVATAITAAPGCADAVHVSPSTGFMIGPGATRAVTVSCSPAPAGMQRCGYQVVAGTDVLAEFEAVCAYAGAASLAASPTTVDLGAPAVGATASASVAIRNNGAAFDRVSIEVTDLTGTFAVAAPCNPDGHACDAGLATVATGGALPLTVTCTPRSAGAHTAELHVATGAGTRLAAPVALTCAGQGVTAPVLAATPAVIDVGAVEVVGASAGATVRLANAGGGKVAVRDIQIADGGTGAAADWSYAAGPPCTSPGVPPECTLEADPTALAVRFDPRAIGVRDAILLVNYHDTADRSLSIPLRGTGTGATLELLGPAPVLDFGAVPVGARAALAIRVVNRGSRALADATAALQPAAAALEVAPASLAVPVSAPATVTVTCAPTAAGTSTSSLVLAAPDVATPAISLAVRCTGDPDAALAATPPAVLFGEVRLGAPATARVAIASTGAPVMLASATLLADDPRLTVTGAPAATPATLTVVAAPDADGPLTNQLAVAPGPLTVAIAGAAVTAKLDATDVVSLGTFCVRQPTTPRIVALASAGTATIGLPAAPALADGAAFDLALVAPLAYPTTIPPDGRAQVAVTPRRQDTAGVTTDTLTWATDVAGQATVTTGISATFLADGGAIAPETIAFDATPIHLDNGRPRQVTLQNCSLQPLALDAPRIEAPFSIDSPGFPTLLPPGETATFSVGFHPNRIDSYDKRLVITSPQLPDAPLSVHLLGLGIADGPAGSDGVPTSALDPTSFYACGSCASSGPSTTLAVIAAALVALAPRRRRR